MPEAVASRPLPVKAAAVHAELSYERSHVDLRAPCSGWLGAWFLPAALALLILLPGCRRPPATAQSTAPAGIRFVDATASAGIRFRHTNGGFGKKYLPETNGSGVAWLDYDGDGRQDLVFVNCEPWTGIPAFRRSGVGESPSEPPNAQRLNAERPTPSAQRRTPNAAPRPTPALYRNRGDGSFEDRTAGSGLDIPMYGQGVSAADYDADGHVDLLITCLGPNHLFHNSGNGTFKDVTVQAGLAGDRSPWRYHAGSAWLDYDHDGWLDLFVARYAVWNPKTDPFCGVPGGTKRYCPPWKLPREHCALYRNLGNGHFRDVSRETGIGEPSGFWFQPLVLDFNNDGWPDVAVICDGTPMALFRNEGGRRFTDAAPEAGLSVSDTGSPKSQMGIDVADWHNDGREAILVGNFSGERLSLFEPESPGLYTDAADRVGMGESSLYSLTFGVAFLDADRDGWRDAFIANGHIDDYIERFDSKVTYAERPLLYRNLRGERFAEIGFQAGPALAQKLVARGCAVADYDQDGDPDLVVTENNRPAHLFRNDSLTSNHFLRVVLHGKPPNRDAIGARVVITAGGARQIQSVRAGGHYYSQSEFPLTFGLGSVATADLLVTWPRGGTSAQKGVATDRTITIEEASAARQ